MQFGMFVTVRDVPLGTWWKVQYAATASPRVSSLCSGGRTWRDDGVEVCPTAAGSALGRGGPVRFSEGSMCSLVSVGLWATWRPYEYCRFDDVLVRALSPPFQQVRCEGNLFFNLRGPDFYAVPEAGN